MGVGAKNPRAMLGFPDYLLADIGLRRDEMQRKALDPLWRE